MKAQNFFLLFIGILSVENSSLFPLKEFIVLIRKGIFAMLEASFSL